MKKILLAVMAVAAISFTSCGNKTQAVTEEPVDSVALIDSLANETIQETVSALNAQIEAGDANKLQETLEAVKAKIANLVKENPEMAKACVTKLQNFLKENADKLKSVIGENAAAQTVVDALVSIDAENGLAGLLGEIENQAVETKDAAVDAAKAAVNEKVEEGKAAVEQKANEAKEAAKQKANEAIDNAAQDAKKALGL